VHKLRMISLVIIVGAIIAVFSISRISADPVIGGSSTSTATPANNAPTPTPDNSTAGNSASASGNVTSTSALPSDGNSTVSLTGTVPPDAVPGSIDDPMVSKSYVDQQVAIIVANQVAAAVKSLGGSGTSANLKVVIVSPGQTLMAAAGSEFIVRTGTAIAVSKDTNGIPDVTAGKDIAAKTVISLNHLLIFPTESRGIAADAKSAPVYVMARGSYTLLDVDGKAISQ